MLLDDSGYFGISAPRRKGCNWRLRLGGPEWLFGLLVLLFCTLLGGVSAPICVPMRPKSASVRWLCSLGAAANASPIHESDELQPMRPVLVRATEEPEILNRFTCVISA